MKTILDSIFLVSNKIQIIFTFKGVIWKKSFEIFIFEEIKKEKKKKMSSKKESDGKNGGQNKRRKFCEFDDKCTRTNPKHFKEFAHPRKTDRKVCKYLSNCTRNNEKHWMDYRQ